MKVIGIDISLSNLGIVKAELDPAALTIKVEELHLIETAPAEKSVKKVTRQNSLDLERAILLYEALQEHCQGHAMAFAEVPVGSQSARAMASYGICVGVLASVPIPMIQVTPTEVKLAGFGERTATKEEMIYWAAKKHPEAKWLTQTRKGELHVLNKNEHLADACAAIHAGIKTNDFKRAISFYPAALSATH
jgi:hypothetical protein